MKNLIILTLVLFSSHTFGAKKIPLIIGHRGACGYRPEHTLASYQLAIDMGADYIEPDLVMTKDGVLVARHENEISGTTDVAIKFPDRKRTKKVDGKEITGWFIEDFNLKEVKSLKAKERLEFRDHQYDGQFEVPTFEEILKLVKRQKRSVGIYPETKHPTYFHSVGLPLENELIRLLNKYAMNKKNSKVFIQSFELSSLKILKKQTPVPLIYLIDDPEIIPFDHVVHGDPRTYLDMLKPENLKEIATIASGIGPYKRYLIPENKDGHLGTPTNLLKQAHELGLLVHPYTFRADKKYLNLDYHDDPINEYLQFYELGVDGVFSDFSDLAVKAKNIYLGKK